MVVPKYNLNILNQPLLVIFSPSSSNRVFQMQIEQLESIKLAMQDTHLHIAEIFEEGQSRLDQNELAVDQYEQLRGQFPVPKGCFKVYLIGSDSEIHLISENCISWQELLMRIGNVSSFHVPAI